MASAFLLATTAHMFSLQVSLSLSYFSEHECALHTPVEQQQQPSSLPKDAEVELYSLFFS